MQTQMMKKSIQIKANKEKVWEVLLSEETYPKWTSVFMDGSYAKTDWKEGSKALFLGPNGDGMVSLVKVHQPNEIITLEHRGTIKDGKEDYDGEEAQKWKGTTETYEVEEVESGTQLTVKQDLVEDYVDWFEKTWDKALLKVKELSEGN